MRSQIKHYRDSAEDVGKPVFLSIVEPFGGCSPTPAYLVVFSPLLHYNISVRGSDVLAGGGVDLGHQSPLVLFCYYFRK